MHPLGKVTTIELYRQVVKSLDQRRQCDSLHSRAEESRKQESDLVLH